MAVDLKSAEELYNWNRRVLSIGGMWPLDPTFVKFHIGFAYFVTHMILAIMDFISVIGDTQLMIANVLETSIQTMLSIKLLVLRHSGELRQVLRRVHEGANEDNYRDDAEKKLYLYHNSIGKTFFTAGNYTGFITGAIYYTMPIKDLAIAALHNETLPFVLPYRTYLFFNISDIRMYALMYLWQSPIPYYYYCHQMSVCFLCTLVFHVTGEMSILAHRIRLIGTSSDLSRNFVDTEIAICDNVVKHYEVIWTASAINDIFHVVLLEELVISTVLIALVVYNLLANALSSALFEIVFFTNFCIALLLVILVYCITGDYLVRESSNICEAYYECQWYDLKPKYQKLLIICMARAQQPLQLTAGKFYVFSLPRFSEILKTSMAYISMLRNVV